MSKNFDIQRLLFVGLLFLVLVGCGAGESEAVPYAPEVIPATEPTYTPGLAGEVADEAAAPVIIPDLPLPPCPLEEWMLTLSTEEKIGQLLMPRLAWQALEVTTAFGEWMARYPVGGIILFGDNVESISQVQRLTADLQGASTGVPLLIAIDEEGGRVSRVGRLFATAIPAAFDIGRAGDTAAAEQYARETGRRLLSLGINMNFAPVADVWSNPANAVIGNRAFGDCPHLAGEMVMATIYGLQAEGVFAVAKHFPGHGDTYEDSHYLTAFYHHGRERFDAVEALPFRAGIQAGVDGIMVGHISTPLLQSDEPLLDWMAHWLESGTLPATFSDFWLQTVLRREMGFDGLIITDALDMRALTDHFTPEQIALGAFLAGADILLMPTHPERAFYALLEAYRDGIFSTERLQASVRRILALKIE